MNFKADNTFPSNQNILPCFKSIKKCSKETGWFCGTRISCRVKLLREIFLVVLSLFEQIFFSSQDKHALTSQKSNNMEVATGKKNAFKD